MAEFTFLEVHLDGAEFSPNAPFSKTTASDGPDVEVGSIGDEAGRSRKPWLATLIGLLFLVVVAIVAKKKLGSDADPVPELDDYDE